MVFTATVRRAWSAVLFLLVLLAGGCVRNEFNVKFELGGGVNSTIRLSYYGSDSRGGLNVETAVAIAQGKGDYCGITRMPVVAYIYSSYGSLPAAVFYAERGNNITVKGDDANPFGFNIDGNGVNRELTEWRLFHREVLAKSLQAGDAGAHRTLNDAIAQQVEREPGKRSSAILLMTWFDSRLQPDRFAQLLALIRENKADKGLDHLFERQDLATVTPQGGEASKNGLHLVREWAVQSAATNCDTLRGGNGKPVIIWFWQREDTGRQAVLDSIKKLVKWRGDSARFIIADLALQTDSVPWRYKIDADSLQRTLRAWIPEGFAAREVMRLGVRQTPWFIVADGKGKAVYAGQETAAAMAAVRKIAGGTDVKDKKEKGRKN